MFKKNLNFNSIVLKVFFTYLIVYFLALIFRYSYNLEFLLNNIQYKYLIVLNLISIFLGLPLSIIFDFMLLKLFGLLQKFIKIRPFQIFVLMSFRHNSSNAISDLLKPLGLFNCPFIE